MLDYHTTYWYTVYTTKNRLIVKIVYHPEFDCKLIFSNIVHNIRHTHLRRYDIDSSLCPQFVTI